MEFIPVQKAKARHASTRFRGWLRHPSSLCVTQKPGTEQGQKPRYPTYPYRLKRHQLNIPLIRLAPPARLELARPQRQQILSPANQWRQPPLHLRVKEGWTFRHEATPHAAGYIGSRLDRIVDHIPIAEQQPVACVNHSGFAAALKTA